MNPKRLIACSLVALIAVAIFINFAIPGVRRALASSPAAQTNLRKVKIVHGRASPVEVTEVIWNGSPLSPNGGIPSGSDWIGNLQVRFKNKSDKPISFARFMLFDTAIPNVSSLAFVYGKEYSTDTSEPTVAPGEHGVAKPDIAMYGSTTGTTDLKLTTSKVVWNFNYDMFWAVGDLWEVDTSPNAPTKHKRITPAPTPTPQAKATQPLRSPFVEARFNHAPAPAVAVEDPCEGNPFIP
ncbi:MAG TPA: hypothetical protein VGO96_02725, partial [Pyrinomonadaceae bacterium]|nr:hypothetical protein [Pyrinomonadaceae bacterium]